MIAVESARWLWPYALMIGASLGLAVAINISPQFALLGCVLLWFALLIFQLPPKVSITVPVLCLLLLPADHIAALSGALQGLYVLSVTAFMSVLIFFRGGAARVWHLDWDILLLVGILVVSTIVQGSVTQIRGILYWAAAIPLLYWLRAEEMRGTNLAPQLIAAILIAGSIGAAVEVLSSLGLDVRSYIPGYEPDQLEFSRVMGLRGVGLSGHPLRFGTLTMLSSLAALGLLISGRQSSQRRKVLGAVLILSAVGLVLSGARGAWLGFGAALVVGFGVSARANLARLVARVVGYAAASTAFLWATGLWTVVTQRIAGEAAHPGSFEQRLQALKAVSEVAGRVPLLGVGLAGTSDLVLSTGMRAANVENEYLLLFLCSGVLGPVLLLVVGLRRILSRSGSLSITARMAMVAMLLDLATYNLFGWSAGPCLFVMVAVLLLPTSSVTLGSMSNEGAVSNA
jgi:hypothetical protein